MRDAIYHILIAYINIETKYLKDLHIIIIKQRFVLENKPLLVDVCSFLVKNLSKKKIDFVIFLLKSTKIG